MKFVLQSAALASLISAAAARDIPSNVQAFLARVKSGQCTGGKVLKQPFYSVQGGSEDFAYCQDTATGVLYLHGTGSDLANMDIDCDGDQSNPGDGRCGNSADTQSETAFKDLVEQYSSGSGSGSSNVTGSDVTPSEATASGVNSNIFTPGTANPTANPTATMHADRPSLATSDVTPSEATPGGVNSNIFTPGTANPTANPTATMHADRPSLATSDVTPGEATPSGVNSIISPLPIFGAANSTATMHADRPSLATSPGATLATSPSASQPTGLSASQPTGLSASQPTDLSASQPTAASPSTSIPSSSDSPISKRATVSDLNANFIPYVVFGNQGSAPGYTTFDPQQYGLEPLSVMAVVCGDQLVYGVWGDTNGDDGPPLVGEASIALATACFGTGITGDNGHDTNDVLYIAFPGSVADTVNQNADWGATSFTDFDNSISALGDSLVAKLS